MEYRTYQHVCRLDTEDTEGLLKGRCIVQPKLDGSNATLFLGGDGRISAGSRRKQLSSESDGIGFYASFSQDERFAGYFAKHPDHRLFGEYLQPHTLKTYLDYAWDEFYVFDVCIDNDDREIYLTPDVYIPMLNEYGISYVPTLAEFDDPTMEELIDIMERNTWLIMPGMGLGEGIVIKNYEYTNPFGRQTWGKMITSEYVETRRSQSQAKEERKRQAAADDGESIERQIVHRYISDFVVEKEYQKMVHEEGYDPRKGVSCLLRNLYHVLCTEEMWNMVRDFSNPTVDFSMVSKEIVRRIREVKPEMFVKGGQ